MLESLGLARDCGPVRAATKGIAGPNVVQSQGLLQGFCRCTPASLILQGALVDNNTVGWIFSAILVIYAIAIGLIAAVSLVAGI